MFLTTIFTLSCLPLMVLTGGFLFYVDITMLQKEGRQESEDILFIETTLRETTDIKVHHARKAFDNQQVVLVLEVEETCYWSNLTSALSSRGYKVSVRPVQRCTDYAQEIGVNVTYRSSSEVEAHNVLMYYDVTIYDQGIKTDDYLKKLKNHFKRDITAMEAGIIADCYRIYGHIPVKLMYFVFVNSTEVTEIEEIVHNAGRASQEITLLQSFRAYIETC